MNNYHYMKYSLMSLGHYLGEEYPSYDKAKEALSLAIESSLSACRSKYGEGKKVKMREDCYKIEFGGNIWSAYWLQKY